MSSAHDERDETNHGRQLVNSFRYVDASGAEPDPLALAQGFIPVFIARKVFIFKKIGRGERI